jgi:tetratricopeptide (TPR) repeat protein
VETVVTGELRVVADGLELELAIAHGGRVLLPVVRSATLELDRLIEQAVATLALLTPASAGAVRPLDLRGVDGAVVRARSLMSAGFFVEALAALEGVDQLHPIDAQLRADLATALAGGRSANPALDAMVALALPEDDVASRAFAQWSRSSGAPPVAHVWAAVWAVSVGDREGADAAFESARRYPYGAAAAAADLALQGGPEVASAALALLRELQGSGSSTALLAASFVANALGGVDLEEALLGELARLTPFFAYPFERRSFIAFDRNDPISALRNLAIAVELEPDSDLYWTNLGWAWYLAGLLERSEEASLRALAIDPGQVIARYNLGLVQTVSDRIEEALSSYREALRFDPVVEPEAIVDLEQARNLYPDQVGVSFALGFLQERAGARAAAADSYAEYLRRAAATPGGAGVSSALVREAQRRQEVLRRPLPPLELGGEVLVSLGRRGPVVAVAQPGDPLALRFEVTTPGEALPRQLEVRLSLLAAGRVLPIDAPAVLVEIPDGAIGFVIDSLQFELPLELDEGSYRIEVEAAGGGQVLAYSLDLAVAGEANLLRRLVGRALVFSDLERGAPLLGERDLSVSAAVVWARLVAELQGAAELAEAVLPEVQGGRFAGLGGGEIFAGVDEEVVRDFVEYLLERGSRNSTLVLAEAFADWVLIGAP